MKEINEIKEIKEIKRIRIIENVIAVAILLTMTYFFIKGYSSSPKIAVLQYLIAVIIAFALLVVSAKKTFYTYIRNLLFLFALVPMVSFNYISEIMGGQFTAVPKGQIIIVYGVNMLPITLFTVLIICAYLIMDETNRLNKLTYCMLGVAAVAVICSFLVTELFIVFKYIFGLALLVIVIQYFDRIVMKINQYIPTLVMMIFLFFRVIYLFISKAYY